VIFFKQIQGNTAQRASVAQSLCGIASGVFPE